jgi:pimeloyl-ACP methyl ester carboxylesterase
LNTIYKGLPVHYEIKGEGFPLIFLHGFNESSAIWNKVVPELPIDYQCISIDLPGFGQSALPDSLTIKYMADAVHRVIDELKLVKPIIIGHSMGGYVTLELVQNYPNLVSGAGLFHSTAFADSEEKKNNRTKTIDFLERNPVELFFKTFIQGLFAPFNFKPSMINQVETMVYKTLKKSVMAATLAMRERGDRTNTLKNSTMPWLFIAGKHDSLIPLEQITLQSSFCNRSMIELLNNSGHLGMFEEPIQAQIAILKFAEWVKLLETEENQN